MDNDDVVSSEEFPRHLDEDPVGDYEAMFRAAVKELLDTSMSGPTVSHGEVRDGIRKRLRNRR